MKTIKIIDILCYISTGEYDKLPKRIRYRYGGLYKDFTFDGEGLNYISGKDFLFGEDITAMLNDEVEILDEKDEFEYIEELYEPQEFLRDGSGGLRPNKNSQEYKINQLIKNQKKIIERLKEEGK